MRTIKGKEILGCLGGIALVIGMILWAEILGVGDYQGGVFCATVLGLPIIIIVIALVDIIGRKLR